MLKSILQNERSHLHKLYFCLDSNFPFSAAPLLLLLPHSFLSWKIKTHPRRLAPGPPSWPLIGNLLDLGYHYKAPHKRLAELQKRYGPVFMIRMGAVNTLVIASADAALELFKSHDQAFINRHPIQALQPSNEDNHGTPWSPHGPIWRIIGDYTQLFSLIKQWILVEEKEGRSVEIKHLTLVAFANLLGNLFFSRDVMDLESATGNELYQLLEKIGVLSTMPNIADFFPWLRNLDPQNLANRTMNAVNACADIVDGFAKERRITDAIRNNKEEKDYWDLLIDFEGNGKDEPRKLSDRHINWFITEIFIGGTDSLINSIEWVMSEVVRNPEVMRKAKDEIGQVVGYHRKIDESD
ncbi:hypothetical protein C5167_018560 [Papaver somniferum]|uniref:Cytochrome P450 n=1 Tax=Papaver somniferum TaxID=3469 RepID=A0A4Y7IRM5_PAPSO|nr:hypothetical protein C5167_018560 [Papaver somniferum]